jgi:hypothetical protein
MSDDKNTPAEPAAITINKDGATFSESAVKEAGSLLERIMAQRANRGPREV